MNIGKHYIWDRYSNPSWYFLYNICKFGQESFRKKRNYISWYRNRTPCWLLEPLQNLLDPSQNQWFQFNTIYHVDHNWRCYKIPKDRKNQGQDRQEREGTKNYVEIRKRGEGRRLLFPRMERKRWQREFDWCVISRRWVAEMRWCRGRRSFLKQR